MSAVNATGSISSASDLIMVTPNSAASGLASNRVYSMAPADQIAFVNERELERMHEDYRREAERFARNEIFPLIQFITFDSDIAFGTKLQRKVCYGVNIPVLVQHEFWVARGGMETIRNAIGRKRQIAGSGMKEACGKG